MGLQRKGVVPPLHARESNAVQARAAGGLNRGAASAALGFTTLTRVLFGLGITSFVDLPG